MNVCIFCSSKSDLSPSTFEQATLFCDKLQAQGHSLVYGGGLLGLMGHFADRMLERSGRVIGVMPEATFENEVAHQGLTELVYTKDMLDRKRVMMQRSEAFVIFPGGIGTMDEAIEVITWKTIYKFDKPIVFFNWENYWNPFLEMLKSYEKTNLFYPETMQAFQVVENMDELMEVLSA
jgi:uncharacterized protein (TIGR00730 family)